MTKFFRCQWPLSFVTVFITELFLILSARFFGDVYCTVINGVGYKMPYLIHTSVAQRKAILDACHIAICEVIFPIWSDFRKIDSRTVMSTHDKPVHFLIFWLKFRIQSQATGR